MVRKSRASCGVVDRHRHLDHVVAEVGEQVGGPSYGGRGLGVRLARDAARRGRRRSAAGRRRDRPRRRSRRWAGLRGGTPRRRSDRRARRASPRCPGRCARPRRRWRCRRRGSPDTGPEGSSPRLALRPNSPHAEAGIRIEPPPSLAAAHGTMPAATAAAEPPEEPPGVWSVSQGLRVGPYRCGSVTPLAPNSGLLVLPNTTRPASTQRRTTSAVSAAGTRASARLPPLVGIPARSWWRSLSRNGTPAKGRPPSGSGPCGVGGSTSRTIALIRGFTSAARARAAASSSSGVVSPARTRAASPTASWSR